MNLSIEREGLSIKVEASEDFAQHALNLVANIVVTVVRAIETYNADDDIKERDTMPPPAHTPEPPAAISPEVPPAITVLQQAAPVPVSVQPPSPNVPPAQAAGFVFPIPR